MGGFPAIPPEAPGDPDAAGAPDATDDPPADPPGLALGGAACPQPATTSSPAATAPRALVAQVAAINP